MAYSRVNRTQSGMAAIEYVLQEIGHNGSEKRNEIVTAINMCSNIPYHQQMEKYWIRARVNHKMQIIRVIQSFSKKEFDPENPGDILKANLVGQEFARKHYPGRQILVCTQTDGKGSCVHNHILINDVSMIDNKGCTKEQYYHFSVRMWTDEVTEKYTVLDCGNGQQYADKLTKAEKIKLEKGEYCWKQDLRERITKSMDNAVSEEDFIKKLADNGVKAEKRYVEKRNEYYLLYTLLDLSKISEKDKKKRREFKIRAHKLGIDYGLEALDAAIESNKAEMQQNKLQSNTKKDYSDIGQALAADKGNADALNLQETKDKINSVSQNVSTAEIGENDYEPGRKKAGASASKNEETKAVVSPEVYEAPNENTKLNFNIPPINLNDILNDKEDEDKKENLHTVRKTVEPKCVIPDNTAEDSSKSVEISTKSTEQSASKKSVTEQVPKEASNEPVKAKKTHTRKPIFGNKASKNKPNNNNWKLPRLYKATGLTANIQPEQEDDEFSR